MVGVGSGLDALRLALLAGGLEPGAEVIVPAGTFIATVEAVTQAGGVPVLVDMHEDDLNLDVQATESAIGPSTQALLPVHLYGQMADMGGLGRIAATRACCSSRMRVRPTGPRGMDPRGHGGHRRRVQFLSGQEPRRRWGTPARSRRTTSPSRSVSARCASTGSGASTTTTSRATPHASTRSKRSCSSHKLPSLDAWNGERRSAAAAYLDGLSGVGDLVLPPVPKGSEPVWHLFVIRTTEPEALGAFLRERGIASGRHYPQPIHMTGAYRHLGHRLGDFPVAERLGREGLSLPIYPGMTDAQVQAVIDGVRAYFAAA